MRSTKASPWVLGTAFLVVVLLAASWFLLISPVLAQASETNATADQVEADNQRLEDQIEVLAAQFADIETYRGQLAALRTAVPADDELDGYLRELQATADAHGVTILTVSPSTPVLFAPAAAAPPAAPAPEGQPAEGSEQPAAGSTPAPGAAQPAPAAVAPLVVPEGMAAIPLSLGVVGTFDGVRAFLEALQTGTQRLLLVESLTGSSLQDGEAAGGRPATSVGDVEISLTGYLFALPDPAPVAPPTEEAAPAPLPAAPPGKNPLVPVS